MFISGDYEIWRTRHTSQPWANVPLTDERINTWGKKMFFCCRFHVELLHYQNEQHIKDTRHSFNIRESGGPDLYQPG